jgi:hypothetical protein
MTEQDDELDAIRETAKRAMQDFLRQSMEAAKRSPADVIDADQAEPMSVVEFDSALWSSLCGRVDAGANLSTWPQEVRAYYATRYVDWEVMNGGFRQAIANIPDIFPEAVAGYVLLGRSDLAELLRRALAASDLASLDALDEDLDVNDDLRVAFVREHRHAFRL